MNEIGAATGALSTMPAVRTFSLYAGMAILFDFALQVTCFAALFTVDVRRQEARRLELAYCVRLAPPPSTADSREGEGVLYAIVRDYYTPLLMHPYVKVVVVRHCLLLLRTSTYLHIIGSFSSPLAQLFLFIGWLCSSVAVIGKLDVGLDQALAMPEVLEFICSLFATMFQAVFLSVAGLVRAALLSRHGPVFVRRPTGLLCGEGQAGLQ